MNAAVVNNDGGDIVLAANGNVNTMPAMFNAADDDVLIAANVTATGGNGNVTLFAGGDIIHNTGTVSAVGAGTVLLSAGEDFFGGMNRNGNAIADIVQAEVGIVASDTGMVTLQATRNVTLGQITSNGTVRVDADFDNGIGADISNGTGAINDANAADDSASNITANTVILVAATGVGSGTTAGTNADIDTAVTNFTSVSGGTGPVNIHNRLDGGPVIVTTLTTTDNTITFTQAEATVGNGADVQFNGMVTSNDAGGGNGDIRLISDNDLTVTATGSVSSLVGTGGTLTVAGGTILGTIDIGAGDIFIQAGGLDTIIGNSLNGTGPINVFATRDVIIRSSVTTNSGAITIRADTDNAANMDGFGTAQGGVLIEAAGFCRRSQPAWDHRRFGSVELWCSRCNGRKRADRRRWRRRHQSGQRRRPNCHSFEYPCARRSRRPGDCRHRHQRPRHLDIDIGHARPRHRFASPPTKTFASTPLPCPRPTTARSIRLGW